MEMFRIKVKIDSVSDHKKICLWNEIDNGKT